MILHTVFLIFVDKKISIIWSVRHREGECVGKCIWAETLKVSDMGSRCGSTVKP